MDQQINYAAIHWVKHLFYIICIIILSCMHCDYLHRRIYWANIGEEYYLQTIEMASMDGRNRSVLHDTDLSQITSLTIDYQRQVLYWVNVGTIECSNIDGSNRRMVNIHVDGVGFPYGLAILDDTLFLTDRNYVLHAIKMVDTNGGNATGIFSRRFSCIYPRHIFIVSDQKQPTREFYAPLYYVAKKFT